jgi:sulfoxide reductase heme-binding subunit YedZ
MNLTLWYLSRATGVVSLVLLTVVLVLGVLTSGRRRPHGEHATVVMGIHRWLSLGLVAFLLTHVATAVVETYVTIDLVSAVVPFTSGYEPLWVGFGTVAFDLLVAVAVTSWARHRIPERAWRVVHYAAYLLWPVALVHGFVLGTSDEPLLRGVTALCGIVGVGMILWRLLALPHPDRDRRDAVLEQEWS